MDKTRVDSKKLQAAVAMARKHLEAAQVALNPYLADLTEAERVGLVRPSPELLRQARGFAEGLGGFPELRKLTGFESAEVVEDLDNLALLDGLALLDELVQRRQDSRLLWSAEVAEPCLGAYRVAKVQSDPRLARTIEPMAAVFGAGKRRPKKPDPTS